MMEMGNMDLQPSDALPNMKPECADPLIHSVMSRHGRGQLGRRIGLLTNHFKVSVRAPDTLFYKYNVYITLEPEDKQGINSKCLGRKVIDRLYKTYSSELGGKIFAYDGETSLYTVGPLPHNNFEFGVVLEESFVKCDQGLDSDGSPQQTRKRFKHSNMSKTIKVTLSYSARIPLISAALALRGNEADSAQEALQVLNVILRQQAAKMDCLLVRQSFFYNDPRNFIDVGGGLTGCRGFHSRFHATEGGLSLNMDVSTTVIVTPGPVINFLMSNQNIRDPRQIDWAKARRILRNMRIKTKHTNREFKIIGLSEQFCNKQLFPFKVKSSGNPDGDQTVEITVYDYFTKHREITLSSSAYMPCLDVGKSKKPIYLPLELCSLVSLQHYTKSLSAVQRSSLVEKSRQKPKEKIQAVTDAMSKYLYDKVPMFAACGITIEMQLTRLDGRVLEAPKLKVGEGADCIPQNGRWNFNNQKFLDQKRINRWAIVNFSSRIDASHLSRELSSCARNKGVHIERALTILEEEVVARGASPVLRVEKMFERLERYLDTLEFILCILPERKNSDIYGPWKKRCLCDYGIITQCVASSKINDRYLTNLLLKINAKLGGTNSLLAVERPSGIPLIKDAPTMILGLDVSHGSHGRSDSPSIAAVVGSRYWPLISKYRASVRAQSPKVEMIQNLYGPSQDGHDYGIIRELLMEFYTSSNGRKPSQIIIFRDGVGESQFNKVLNYELEQIIQVYRHLKETNLPKFTVIVAQKNHHTKLFLAGGSENVPPGTVVDTNIVHPRNYDFYMCSHPGIIGTSRPAHYHVLHDEIGFSPDDLQNLIYSLSYVSQRSTTALSIVAPIYYAHHAAYQMSQFLNFEDWADSSSEQADAPIPVLPRLHDKVKNSMFFC
ncbi:Argonaute, linker 1 domain [Dillenia turbinata]|uniref:Argonaute, linker 1 domain n=1 Tax=Dillenia turbinata TaxID=194707 RepID=A0AAN8V1K1_9MAGN